MAQSSFDLPGLDADHWRRTARDHAGRADNLRAILGQTLRENIIIRSRLRQHKRAGAWGVITPLKMTGPVRGLGQPSAPGPPDPDNSGKEAKERL